MKTALRAFIVSLLLPCSPLWALQHVEVWFLSGPTVGQSNSRDLPHPLAWILSPQTGWGPSLVQTFQEQAHRQCQAMGEEFFHPQFGVHREGHNVHLQVSPESLSPTLPRQFLSAHETSLIECDDEQYFDMFCGKARGQMFSPPASFEVWIDISGSLREIDLGDQQGHCYRQGYVDQLRSLCGAGVDFYLFTSHRKLMGSSADACLASGTNRTMELLKEAMASSADTVLYITDISEYTTELTSYLDQVSVTYLGHDRPLLAKDLLKQVPRLKKYCTP